MTEGAGEAEEAQTSVAGGWLLGPFSAAASQSRLVLRLPRPAPQAMLPVAARPTQGRQSVAEFD